MIKILLAVVLFYVNIVSSTSQGVFPAKQDKPVWLQGVSGLFIDDYTDTFTFDIDTLICGQKYTKVVHNPKTPFSHSATACFIRAEGSKIFARQRTDCPSKEFLMYDFSLKKGDIVYCGWLSRKSVGNSFKLIDSSKFEVIHVDSAVYEGVLRKRLLMAFEVYPECDIQPCTQWSMYWIEGIGSTFHPFYSFECLVSTCEIKTELNCFESKSKILYRSPFSNCRVVTATEESDAFNSLVKLYPTVGTLRINIENKSDQKIDFKIYTFVGNLVLESSIFSGLNALDISALNTGVYLLCFKYKAKDSYLRFVKL
jgi:hypothetical protein